MAPRVGSAGPRLAHAPGTSAVRLEYDRALPGNRALVRDAAEHWRITLPVGVGVQRLDHCFALTRRHRVKHILDPDNPHLVAGVFGPRTRPGSSSSTTARSPPSWLCSPAAVMGASLGGLAAVLGIVDNLDGGRGRIGAVLAQSASFFTGSTDRQERRFRFFDRIGAHVGALAAGTSVLHPLVIGMTCGALEENVANNRAMAGSLRRSGHAVTY